MKRSLLEKKRLAGLVALSLLGVLSLFGLLLMSSAGVLAQEEKPVRKEGEKVETGQYWCYVGTYTKAPNEEMKEFEIPASQGILVAPYDDQKGAFGDFQLAAEAFSPTWLTVSPDGRTLYAVGEGSPKSGTAKVMAFEIDASSGKLYPLNELETKSGAPCHVAVHSSGKFLCVSNYSGGDFVLYSIQKNGSIGKETDRFKPEGQGEDEKRQAGPHAHGAYFSGDRLFLCDLGTDKVYIKQLDTKAGKFTADPIGEALEFQPGAGPRHLSLLEKEGKTFVFVCNELDSTVNVFGLDEKEIHQYGSYSTLWPEFAGRVVNTPSKVDGEEIILSNTTAEVVATANDRVYVSNRGHDSIAMFELTTGDEVKLTIQQCEPTFGKNPRYIGLDPSGKKMIACNQDSATIYVYTIDPSTGKLSGDSNKPYWAPYPVAMQFVLKQE